MASTSKKTQRRPRKRPVSPRLRLPANVGIAVEAALDKKAADLLVLDFRKTLSFTDCFLICTGGNIRQVQAIADGIVETLRQKGLKPSLVEGYEHADWILIDYFDFIVHVFTPVTREFYSLERLWADAVHIAIPAK